MFDRDNSSAETRWRALAVSGIGIGVGILVCIALIVGRERTHGSYQQTLYVFGTLVEIVIRDARHDVARRCVNDIAHDFQQMHRDWHAWRPGALHDVNNALAHGEAVAVSPQLAKLLRQAKTLSLRSDGLFNPAIGKLVALWGFHGDERPSGALPDNARVQELVALMPQMEDVEIDGDVVTSRNRAVQFDMGGFAKGAALDLASSRLKGCGIGNAIVNAGGDLNTIGVFGARPWRVGIRHPAHWGVIASVDMGRDEVLYTSGNYERFRERDGVRYAHIIDPRTGMPVQHVVSVSVLHTNGALADAAATALAVAGPKEWQRIAARMGVAHVMLVDDEGHIFMTQDMRERIRLHGSKPTSVTVAAAL